MKSWIIGSLLCLFGIESMLDNRPVVSAIYAAASLIVFALRGDAK